jgi:hypothetical protein
MILNIIILNVLVSTIALAQNHDYYVTGQGFTQEKPIQITTPCAISSLPNRSPIFLRCEKHDSPAAQKDEAAFLPAAKRGKLWYLREGQMNWISKIGKQDPKLLKAFLKKNKARVFGLEAFHSRILGDLLLDLRGLVLHPYLRMGTKELCEEACDNLSLLFKFSRGLEDTLDHEGVLNENRIGEEILQELIELGKEPNFINNRKRNEGLKTLLFHYIKYLKDKIVEKDCHSFGFNNIDFAPTVDQLLKAAKSLEDSIHHGIEKCTASREPDKQDCFLAAINQAVDGSNGSFDNPPHPLEDLTNAGYVVRDEVILRWRNVSFFESIMSVYCEASQESKPIVVSLGSQHCPGVHELIKNLDPSIQVDQGKAGIGLKKIPEKVDLRKIPILYLGN